MPRRRRIDRPGLLHHVINRAIARRTAFETRRDIRMFLALVARAVREGRIEVHAYSILATHFHLLVRSLDGRLSETMRRIENAYVRWFNRTRRRDGSLFRGRFRSIPVESARYLHVLLRYIDQNAVAARLVSDALTYPHGSAESQAGVGRRRPWLSRTLVDQFLPGVADRGHERIMAYRRAFAPSLSSSMREFVERRVARGACRQDELDDLVGTASADVRAWMVRKAQLADGTAPGLPLVSMKTAADVVDIQRRRSPGARIQVGARTERVLWDVALVALLRDLAGESFRSIGRRTATLPSEASRAYADHCAAVKTDVGYAGILTELARRALELDHGTSTVPAALVTRVASLLSPICDTRA